MISGAVKGSFSESQTEIFFSALESTTQRCKELEFEIPRPRVSQHHTMLEPTGYQLAIYYLS